MTWTSLELARATLHESWIRTNPIAALEFVVAARRHLVDGCPVNYRESIGRFVGELSARSVRLPALWKARFEAHLPRRCSSRFEAPRPRVVGLAVLQGDGLLQRVASAFVVPLEATPSTRWAVQAGLPCTADLVQAHFERLADEPGMRETALVERFACTIGTPLGGLDCHGSSLDVAMVLSAIDAAGGCSSPLFAGACALVAPGPDGRLHAVESIEKKLHAYAREYEEGASLFYDPRTPLPEALASRFAERIAVTSWHELFVELHQRGLLAPLCDRRELTPPEALRVDLEANARLERFDFVGALRLVQRADRHGFASAVPMEYRLRLLRRRVGALANLGMNVEAADAARALLVTTEDTGDLATFDDLARGATTYASQLFHLARYQEIEALLGAWRERIVDEPRLIPVETRIAVLNTLARTASMRASVGAATDDWRELYARSLGWQRRTDASASIRTLNYQTASALRCGDLSLARNSLTEARARLAPRAAYSHRFITACEAELARREGQIAHAADMDSLSPEHGAPCFPAGMYFVATARQRWSPQQARPLSITALRDATQRLRRAEDFFAFERRSSDPSTIDFVISAVRLLRHAADVLCGVPNAEAAWREALTGIHTFLADVPSLRAWHEGVLPEKDAKPSLEASDAFVERLPYF